MPSTASSNTRSQVNVRIPLSLKEKAQKKAATMHLSLSFIVTHFLEKFAEEDIIRFHSDIDFDTVFDTWVIAYCESDIWKKTRKRVGNKVKRIIREIS